MRVYAAVMILVYPLGCPLLLFIVLFRHRGRLNPQGGDWTEAEIMQERLEDPVLAEEPANGFAYIYRPRFWWFEIYNMSRRLILTSVVLAFRDLNQTVVFVLFVGIITLVIEQECKAYADAFLSAFTAVCCWQVHEHTVISNALLRPPHHHPGHSRVVYNNSDPRTSPRALLYDDRDPYPLHAKVLLFILFLLLLDGGFSSGKQAIAMSSALLLANLGIMATIFAETKVTEKLRKVSSATRFSRFSRATTTSSGSATTTSSGSARASGADAGAGRAQAKLELELELSELDQPQPGHDHVNPLFKPRSAGNRVTMDDTKSIDVAETVVETVVETEAATGTGNPMMHMAEGELPAATDGAPDVV